MSASAWLDLIRDTKAWLALLSAHHALLMTCLIILALSCMTQALWEIFHRGHSATGLASPSPTARNQLRAYNGMLLGIGILAIWASVNLDQARQLVQALGVVLLPSALARLISFRIDGAPHWSSRLYYGVELGMGLIFLLWPPVSR
ncbi:MAG: DUF4345 domain-containing protein [Gammaproteobacteria bacterium]|nr:MAG: DUF4345 domain-containing protein [Gammaproteobacteria bacterium]